jgi:polyhydroxyalkanoate synthesis regulator phasin
MAVSDPWKHYLEAGMELTEVTRARAEKLVKDLVKAGEVQRHEAQERVDDLLARSRKTTEAVAETVRVEVMRQLQTLGLVQPAKKAASTAKKAAKKTTTSAKTTAKKAAKKTTGQS